MGDESTNRKVGVDLSSLSENTRDGLCPLTLNEVPARRARFPQCSKDPCGAASEPRVATMLIRKNPQGDSPGLYANNPTGRFQRQPLERHRQNTARERA